MTPEADIPVKEKDPDEVLDFPMDWSDWLASGETISTSSWAVETGITKDSDSKTNTVATIWLSGGTAGYKYRCTNTIVTSQSRTAVRAIDVFVDYR